MHMKDRRPSARERGREKKTDVAHKIANKLNFRIFFAIAVVVLLCVHRSPIAALFVPEFISSGKKKRKKKVLGK